MPAYHGQCAEWEAGRACQLKRLYNYIQLHCNTHAALACRFAALARLLNQAGGGDELIQLVEAGQHALNPEAAAEYLRALANTGRLAEYAREGPMRCATLLLCLSDLSTAHLKPCT